MKTLTYMRLSQQKLKAIDYIKKKDIIYFLLYCCTISGLLRKPAFLLLKLTFTLKKLQLNFTVEETRFSIHIN